MITKTMHNMTGEYMTMYVEDDESGIRVLSVEMPMAEMMKALTSAYGAGTMVLGDIDKVGMVREVKYVGIPWDHIYYTETPEDEITEVLAEYEVDGWVARRGDMLNQHKRRNCKQYVAFIRFVDKVEND